MFGGLRQFGRCKQLGGGVQNGIDGTVHHAWNDRMVNCGVKKDIVCCENIAPIGADAELRKGRGVEIGLYRFKRDHR